MSIPDISDLSTQELNELISMAKKLIRKNRSKEIRALKAEMAQLAAARGLSLDEVMGSGRAGGKKRAPVAPKYRDPNDPAVTWSGRGRKPRWFEEALEAGKTPEDMAI